MIITEIGIPACLEQLAEECSETSKAALKLARVMRGENPTPVTEKEAIQELKEEVADIRVCLGVLGCGLPIMPTDTFPIERKKRIRWEKRIEEKNNEK